MTTVSMPTLSSLELMLEKIQQLENEPKDVLPPLPVRPVSKGRLLPRARRLLPNNLQRSGTGNKHNNGDSSVGMLESEEAFVESAHHQEPVNGDVVAVAAAYASKSTEELIQIDSFDDTRERKVQGALVLQRCFRGYQARCEYNELKSRVISLQSLIRGENARNAYQSAVARLTKDRIKVPHAFLANLQRQVLRTEAALRNTEAENVALQKHLNQYEKRWMEYETRMKSMEKMWQDQLTIMQISLSAARKGRAVKPKSERSLEKLFHLPHEAEPQLNIREDSISHTSDQHNVVVDDDYGNFYRVKTNWDKDIVPEFQKLERKFDAWKKDYKIRLEEAKTTMKKVAHSKDENKGKTWWRKQSNLGI